MPSNIKFYPLGTGVNAYVTAAPKGGAVLKAVVYDPEYLKADLQATLPRFGIMVDEAVGATAVVTRNFYVVKVPYGNSAGTLPSASLSKNLTYVGNIMPIFNSHRTCLEDHGGYFVIYESVDA